MSKIKVSIQKKSKKGGFRPKQELALATQRLLEVLWKKLGGPHALKRKTGVAAQRFIHWRNQGKVSLKAVGPISRKLGVDAEALNYKEVGRFYGANARWDMVLAGVAPLLGFTDIERDYIEAGKAPLPYGTKKKKKAKK